MPPAGCGCRIPTPLAAPAQYFELTFNAAAGKGYRLWVRGQATSNHYADDSAYMQFDRSVDSTGAAVFRIGTASATTFTLEDRSGCGLSGRGWQDNGYGTGVLGPLVYFATSGAQRIRVQVREDGLGLDQIILSSGKLPAAGARRREERHRHPPAVTQPRLERERASCLLA